MPLLVKSWLLFQPFNSTLGNTKLAPGKLDANNGFSGRKLKSMMEMLQFFLLFVLLNTIVLTGLVHAQDQSGFISLDCGLPDNGSYVDPTKDLNYNSDAAFIDTGISKGISSEFQSENEKQFHYVRSFPEGRRNCYKVNVNGGSKYLIRARFMYGNYDGQNEIPKFDVYVGPRKWFTVQLEQVDDIVSEEIIHDVSTRNYIFVCLMNTDSGTPFISALELRPLNNLTYKTKSGSLMLHSRLDLGSTSTTNHVYRYPHDIYDRIWTTPQNQDNWKLRDTLEHVANEKSKYKQPSIVMQTAIEPTNTDEPLSLTLGDQGSTSEFYTYMHFAEIENLQDNESREFDISLNGENWFNNKTVSYLSSSCIYSTYPDNSAEEGEIIFSLTKTTVSTLPPLINAIEIYYALDLSSSHSNQEDVDAMMNIKSAYKIAKNWQGDPCDAGYVWEGLNCSYNDDDQHIIICLNLSSSALTGEISHSIHNLPMLQSLDLSNNNLTGPVPDFLSDLTSLKVLNLAGNQLSGSVPAKLIERSNQKLLELSVGGNPNLCVSLSCKKKKKKHTFVVPIVASFAVVIMIIVALVIFWNLRRQKQKASKGDAKTNISLEPQRSRKRSFAYSEIIDITNNFQKLIGKGGFGEVFYGCLDDETEVAVKLLNPSSNQGYKEFKAEVNHLLRVHHRNLATLVGFCDDGTNKVLIYEYMANRDLEKHLSGRTTNALSWERRLQIVVDTASGLEYLHKGCKPPIVHRDVKTSNILLDDKFQAKLADFGISRSLLSEGATNTSTVFAGTPGYLDPEYSVTNMLTEKSDVYSFGILLSRIITGKPVIKKTSNERTHLITWVSAMVEKGDIQNIVDPRLGTDFNINSAWKAVEIAMACASSTATKRPTMHQVVNELNECLATEIAQTTSETEVKNDSIPFPR